MAETTEATELQRRNQELAALNAIALATSRSLNLEEMLGFSVATILEIVGGEAGCVLLVEAAARRLSVWGQRGLSPELAERLATIALDGEYWPPAALLDITDLWRIGEAVKDVVRQAGLASCLLLPLRWRDFALGVLLTAGKEALGRWSIEFLMTVSDQLSVAVRNAQLYGEAQRELAERQRAEEETRQRNAELAALNVIAAAVSGSLNLQEILEQALDKVLAVARVEAGAIYLLDQQAEDLVLAAYRGVPQEIADRVRTLPVGTSLAGLAVRLGEPVVVDDATTDPRLKTRLLNEEVIRSFAAIPIKSKENVQGVMHVASYQYHPFSPEEVRLYTAIANQIGVAMENARLYEQGWRQVQELSALEEITRQINATLDVEQILGLVLKRALQMTAAEAGAIDLLDRQQNTLSMRAGQGFPVEVCHARPWSLEQGVIGRVVRTGQPALIADVSQDADYTAVLPQTRSLLAVPLGRQGEVMGVIVLESLQTAAFGQADLWFLLGLAGHAAIALENARLYQNVERQLARLSALADLSRAISSTLDLQEILKTAVERTAQVMEARMATIRLLEGDHLNVGMAVGYREPAAREHPIPIDQRLAQIIAGGQPLILPDLEADPELPPTRRERMRREGVRAYLGVPLIAKDRAIGILSVYRQYVHQWTPEELDLASTIANQVAIAVENARLYTAIAGEKRKLDDLVNSIADGLYTTDRERRITTFNAAAEGITGWRAAEVLGRFCGDVLRMEDEKGQRLCGSEGRCSIAWTLQQGYPHLSWGEQRFIVTKSGVRIPIAAIASPLLDEAGQVVGAVAAFWDISRETKLEQLDKFLSMIAHEILTPLTNIKTAAQSSLRRFDALDKSTQQEMLELISMQCNRLIDFAGKTLRISYLKTGHLAVERQPFAFLPLIERAVGLYRIGSPGCRFEVWTEDSPWAMGDEAQTAVVLEAILENAVKYSPQGGTIRIDLAEGAEDVLVSIADQGRGISLEDQKLVFNEFYRGHTNVANGYGLGLYLAKMLVEAQGGKIWLESESGQGTKVHFTLPKA